MSEQNRRARRTIAAWSHVDLSLWGRPSVIATLALVNFVFVPLDLAIGVDSVGWALAGRAGFALAFLVAGFGLRPGRFVAEAGALTGILASVGLVGLCIGTGGAESRYFAAFFALPLILGVIVPLHLPMVLSATIVSGLGGATLLWRHGTGLWAIVGWLLLLASAGLVAALGAYLYRVRVDGETRAVRERAEALERLADSERRRAESDRLATLGRLAAGVAHEVNNPLAFAVTNLQYLRMTLGARLKGDEAEALDEAAHGLKRIEQIVKDLGSFSRDQGEEAGGCAIAPVVEEAVRLASVRLKNLVKVECAVAAELPPVRGSRSRYVQVLVNLLVNAGDAIDTTGRGGCIRVAAAPADGGVALRVEDDGPGVPPELRARIFEPFFTTKPIGQGTGLGLAVSREFVERAGGRLTVDVSSLGGAAFTLQLPAA